MDKVLQQLSAYARDIWRRRWIGLSVAWLAAVLGALVVLRIPDRYEASARVYVDTESILKPLMAGLAVQPNVNQQVALLSRTLISRPNLEKLIRMNDMDFRLKSPEEKEDLIDRLIKAIKIEGVGGGGSNNLFTISYLNPKPEDAKRVVQSLLTIFMEAGLGGSRKDTENAKRFIEDQIKVYERRLEEAENTLKEFRLKNLALVGPEGQGYLTRMHAMADELGQARLELRAAEESRDALKREVKGEDPVLLPDVDQPVTQTSPSAVDIRIQTLKTNLDDLLRRFTDQHPDVVGTRRVIEELEQQKKNELEARTTTAPKRSVTSANSNPVYQQLKVSLAEAEANVASLRARASDIDARLNQLKASARLQPQIEAEATRLNRDYEIQKKQYETLVARRESASLSGEMDATAGVADFRVIDPPRVSDHPVTPNRLALVPLVLLVALAAGTLASLVVSQIFPTFRDARTLREITGMPVLGAISRIRSTALIHQERRQTWFFVFGVMALVAVYGGWAAWLSVASRITGGHP